MPACDNHGTYTLHDTSAQCPFYGSYSEADPVRIADEGVQQFREEKYEVVH